MAAAAASGAGGMLVSERASMSTESRRIRQANRMYPDYPGVHCPICYAEFQAAFPVFYRSTVELYKHVRKTHGGKGRSPSTAPR